MLTPVNSDNRCVPSFMTKIRIGFHFCGGGDGGGGGGLNSGEIFSMSSSHNSGLRVSAWMMASP